MAGNVRTRIWVQYIFVYVVVFGREILVFIVEFQLVIFVLELCICNIVKKNVSFTIRVGTNTFNKSKNYENVNYLFKYKYKYAESNT